MKIFCIGRNYADHAKEMGSNVPSKPMIFMKPPTALLIHNKPFFYPEFSNDIHYEGEIVLKVAKNGKHIQPEFAEDYIEGIGFGFDFTARDIQQQCKENGHPWEIAKAFDNSAACSEFLPYSDFKGRAIQFKTLLNGNVVQDGTTEDLIFNFPTLITYISTIFTLQKGDYIYTGTPAGVAPIKMGDKLEGMIEGKSLILCEIK